MSRQAVAVSHFRALTGYSSPPRWLPQGVMLAAQGTWMPCSAERSMGLVSVAVSRPVVSSCSMAVRYSAPGVVSMWVMLKIPASVGMREEKSMELETTSTPVLSVSGLPSAPISVPSTPPPMASPLRISTW